MLENVKNLKSHDKGRTFAIIMETLDELGYDVADAGASSPDAKVIDARHFLPQHRERIVLVGIRRDLKKQDFTLRDIRRFYPAQVPSLQSLLESAPDDKYILSPVLWRYLYQYAKNIKPKAMALALASTIRVILTAACVRCQRVTTKMAQRS